MSPASHDRRFQSPAHRPTASYCLCLKQHPRRCPCVSLLRALRVISLLTFAKGPRSPRPHTLTCVSHLGAWQTRCDSGLPGMGPQTTFPTTLGALGPEGQESPEGPLQRWALPPPQAGKRKNGLPTDLRPQTPALGACQETSCLLGTRAECPCRLLVKGPHLGRHRMLGAAPPCPRQSEWRAPLLQDEAVGASTDPALALRPPNGRLVMVAGQASPPGRLLHPTELAGRARVASVLL